MIYNDQFVWLHFPKCAGSKIESIFQAYFADNKSLIQDPVGLKYDPTIAWHDSIEQRSERDASFKLGERTVICSFRKLPSWLISRYSFEFQRSPDLKHDPELLLEGRFLRRDGRQMHADALAAKYLSPQILGLGRVEFIRVEYFERDFRSIFGKFVDLSKIPESEYESKVNKSEHFIPESIRTRLLNNNGEIYEKCPYWRHVEGMAYSTE
ncbi:MAG: hypothetical protein ACKO45_08335 [Cyanobium sp.]